MRQAVVDFKAQYEDERGKSSEEIRQFILKLETLYEEKHKTDEAQLKEAMEQIKKTESDAIESSKVAEVGDSLNIGNKLDLARKVFT